MTEKKDLEIQNTYSCPYCGTYWGNDKEYALDCRDNCFEEVQKLQALEEK